jgi:hypothetical protein
MLKENKETKEIMDLIIDENLFKWPKLNNMRLNFDHPEKL